MIHLATIKLRTFVHQNSKHKSKKSSHKYTHTRTHTHTIYESISKRQIKNGQCHEQTFHRRGNTNHINDQ